MSARARLGKYGLRTFALGYLALLLLIPVGMIFARTFQDGVGPVWDAITSADGLHAFQMTLLMVAMALATIFVSLPFVVREVVPVLQEIGDEQEQAAKTLGANAWQTFRRVTLPAIRWGVAYGVVLSTARALGEFGAVSIVSGSRSGETETLPLFVKKAFDNFEFAGAYGASVLLALLALMTLLAMSFLKRKED